MGDAPSPTITTVPVAVDVSGAPLTAEMAPASIRLARAAIIVFFMGVSLPRVKSAKLNNVPRSSFEKFSLKKPKLRNQGDGKNGRVLLCSKYYRSRRCFGRSFAPS
jgi:hypothetical protein